MKFVSIAATLVVTVGASILIAGQLNLLAGNTPQNLGVINRKLRPPSLTPNSVSSQAALYPAHPQRMYADIAPLNYTGDGEVAMNQLALLLKSSARTTVITQGPGYIYAQSTTAVLQFTDDLEFWLDSQNGVIQMRSASRLGRKDFGTNRARIEAIRARFST